MASLRGRGHLGICYARYWGNMGKQELGYGKQKPQHKLCILLVQVNALNAPALCETRLQRKNCTIPVPAKLAAGLTMEQSRRLCRFRFGIARQ